MIDDTTLLAYFHRGLIPGPDESEEAFLKRVEQAKPLANCKISTLFGFKIDWVAISYSNHQIAWWEGAATWISDDQLPSIQLRTNFQKGSFLGYLRSDVLSHEAVHAARMRFEEPQFEEVLAYATASQAWKRFFGPLFSRTWEPLVLILALLLGIWWPLIPLLLMGLSLGWLTYRQWAFKRCCRKVSLSVILCLTDREIRKIAWKVELNLEKDLTPRVRLIRLLFLDTERKG